MNKLFEKGFTHGGVFHADDVFASAMLRLINPDIEIKRGFEVPAEFDGVIFDIGMGEFDHHQKNSRVRENGVPFAAFGLLFERFGELIIPVAEDREEFDKGFVQGIDLTDNAGVYNPVSRLISSMNPTWKEKKDLEEAFSEAVELAVKILERQIKCINDRRAAIEIVRAKIAEAEDGILFLEEMLPWKKAVSGSGIKYVIYKSLRGGFNIQAVPKNDCSNELELPFPESWRGATKESLEMLTGIKELSFCHAAGFLATADTFEAANKVARLALNSA